MTSVGKAAIPSHVMARQVGDEMVILDLDTGTYFGLDPVGARVWALLSEGKTVGETREAMLDEFDVGRERLEQDMNELLDKLSGQGLIKIEE